MMIRDRVHFKRLLSSLMFLAAFSSPWAASADQPVHLTTSGLTSWLAAYGDAWESRDPEKAATLFSEDASYQVTPYEQPHIGRNGVREYWAGVTANQQNVQFESQTLGITGNTGIAHWSAEFDVVPAGIRIRLDGIFILEFDESGRCQRLREWWHSETDDAESGN